MPTAIVLLLVTAPILTLSMISGTDWSQEALYAGRVALAASVLIVPLGRGGRDPSPVGQVAPVHSRPY
jgi:hypothetical protein